MTTQEVAARFNELAQTGQWDKVQEELYADNAVSIEPAHAAAIGMGNAEGIEAITHLLQRMLEMQNELLQLKNRLRMFEDN